MNVLTEEEIFAAAIQKPREERAEFLERACAGNCSLRGQVEALLAAHDQPDSLLNVPAADMTIDSIPRLSEGPGTQIGPYKLLQKLGEGGMGAVYVAEQSVPVKRRVALKVIKPGMDTDQVIARFEAERQALAIMDHTNIAKVLDAGATETGRPYFVMELVKGVPITKYCDELNLPIRERLALFVPVCQAIQHAHQKGIIHRDVKPSNVLVAIQDGWPVPKVIDFGVAKALHQRLTDRTMMTEFGAIVGTLEYMSPEQAELSALDIDTRADVYGLGVLLYELLTGTTPLDKKRLRSAAYSEMLRIIREDEPPKPSTRLTTAEELPSLAAHRRTESARLTKEVRGELDWIVMKCLEKDRMRRYETAIGLAHDVERFLQDEPVEACPPSATYRLRKFASKHKASLAVATAFLGLLLTGVAVSTVQRNIALEAAASERRAKEAVIKERERAEANAKLARDNETVAEQERDAANREKNNALAAREDQRETLYAAEMNLVQVAAESRQYARSVQLLDQQRPASGQPDLRGFEWHYWQRKLQRGRLRSVEVPQFASMRGERMFSRDATRLAAVEYKYQGDSPRIGQGLLTVFDSVTGRELFSPFDPFPEQQSATRGLHLLTMSDDGMRLAVAFHNRGSSHISIRDSGSGREINRIEFPGYLVDIELTADGSRIAAAFYELEEPEDSRIGVNVWDTSTGDLVQSLPLLPYFSWNERGRFIYRILWSPDGTRLLRQSLAREATDNTGEYRTVIQIVDVASGAELWQREMPSHKARSWSPDGKLLVIFEAAQPGSAVKHNTQLWDSGTGTTLAILDQEATSGGRFESNVNFSSDGKRLAVVGNTNEIYVWEVPELPRAAGASPLRIAAPHLLLQTSGSSAIKSLAFSADGRELRSMDAGTSIVTWDATAREETGLGPDGPPFRTTKISPDATKIVLEQGNSLTVWDLVKNQEVCQLKTNAGVYVSLRAGGFSPDGRCVALVSNATTPEEKSQIVIHDAQTGEVLNVIRVDKHDSTFPASIVNLEFRPDGRQIAALIGIRLPVQNQGPEQLVAWDSATGMQVFSVATDVSTSRALWYSFDGTSLMVSGPNGRSEEAAVFYDATTGERQRSISLPGSSSRYFFNLRYQMFGANVGADFVGADFVLGDLATGQERLRLRGYDGVLGMAISPDGSRLVLARVLLGFHIELTFWSLKSGRQLLAFRVPINGFGRDEKISFSPDGKRIVAAFSASSSKPIQVWDATPLPEEAETK